MNSPAPLRVQEVKPAKLAMRDCTVALDCPGIIDQGRIADPGMKVARVAR